MLAECTSSCYSIQARSTTLLQTNGKLDLSYMCCLLHRHSKTVASTDPTSAAVLYSRVSDNEYSRETPKVDSLWGIFVTGGWFGGEVPIWERVLHGQLDSLLEIFVTGCFVIGDSTVS